jgi:TonB-dependent SusC/RagA subfamily outer membrane receptor
MKKLIIQIIIFSIFVFSSTCLLFGQENVITGKVTTFDSIPLIGVSIKVKSTKEVVYSDTLGLFTVSCLPKDKLKVTARGFSNQNVKIKGKIKYVFVNLKLKPGPENREMAIGYGHVKDKDKVYSISSLNEKDMHFSQYTDIYNIISARFPGVQIIGGEIIIRGRQTFKGSDAALLVVDGVIVDKGSFASIPTTNIASINILKDAAASIYGARGANGVVVVETKRGGENQ